MTIIEAIQSNSVFKDLSPNALEKALADRSLTGSDTYSSSSLKAVDLVTADLYMTLIALPDFSEGSLSIKYDKDQLKSLANGIASQYQDEKLLGLIGGSATIESIELW